MSTTKPRAPSSFHPKPWYTHLTLDLLIRVLSRSIFHPAITLIAWLCICAMHKHRTPVAYYTLYWAAFLASCDVVSWLNHRLTYGKPRVVKWEKEVVVVTGGGRGLGRVLVEILCRRGVRVGVLESNDGKGEGREELVEGFGVCWEVVDVGNLEGVERGVGRIIEGVCVCCLFILSVLLMAVVIAGTTDNPNQQRRRTYQPPPSHPFINRNGNVNTSPLAQNTPDKHPLPLQPPICYYPPSGQCLPHLQRRHDNHHLLYPLSSLPCRSLRLRRFQSRHFRPSQFPRPRNL